MAVWTLGGVWGSWEWPHWRRRLDVEHEVGGRVASLLALSPPAVAFGNAVLAPMPERPPRLGQERLF